jgi:MOSC domain-containing protein YiiM
MRILSVNVSMGRPVPWRGRTIETGIFKEPVAGRVAVGPMSLEGDRQVERKYHGGEFKAVYAYAAEDHAWWSQQLGKELPYGSFGENLTIEGLGTEPACVGDELTIGASTRLQAVEPRLPCFKLGIRFGDGRMVKRFANAGRWGVYFRVLEAGTVGAGDEARWSRRDPEKFLVGDLARLHLSKDKDRALAKRALGVSALPPLWREELEALSSPEA